MIKPQIMPHVPKLEVRVKYHTRPVWWFFKGSTATLSYRDFDEYREGNSRDAWEVREDFFGIPRDPEILWVFLLSTGRFDRGIRPRHEISVESFWEWRELLQAVLLGEDWAKLEPRFDPKKIQRISAGLLPLFISIRDTAAPAVIATDTTLDAVLATIQLDLLQKAEFRLCARPDCPNKIFRPTRRDQKYCGYDCAHLQSVRNARGTVVSVKS